MPYPGVPAGEMTNRVERCVTRVMSQGHDKSAAIAICHASIVKRKERRAARLASLKAERYGGKPRADLQASDFVLSDERKFPVMTAQDVRDAVSSWGRYRGPASFESFKRRLTALANRKGFESALPVAWMEETKAANYGAKVGETISGALSRGAGGRFTRGDGTAASGRETVNALTARARKPKGGKPKLTDAQAAAAGEKAGIDSEDFAALNGFAKGKQPSEGDANRLVNLGLAERGKDGTLRQTANGRGLLRAAKAGDVQGAKDSLSKARDKKSGEAEAAAKRDAKAGKKAGGASKPKKESQAEQKRQERAAQRRDSELTKTTDRLEEMEALVENDESVTAVERVRRLNQLDALDKRLSAVGGDEELSERISELRKKLEPEEDETAAKEFTVFKQGDTWRWLAVTSNSYRDRDGEIVTQKALEADAERMTASGDYGPLRFWHVGKVEYDKPLDWTTAKAGPGLDIGTTDFSVMHGRMSVEGGEVFPRFAQGLADSEWQVSRGFAHPMGHPVAKAYDEIRSFERSPLPMGSASNPFTSFSVTEGESMANLEDKMKEFAAKFFGGDMTKAKAYADDLTKTDKEIEAKGVAFKEGDAVTATAEAPATTTEAKAEGVEPEAEAASEGETEAVFVGDMLADEFASLLTKSISEALAPMLTAQAELGKRIEAAETATKEMREVDRATHEAVTSVLKGFVTTKESTDKSMAAIDARVKELEGDAPGQGKGYRASADPATITQKQMKQAQPPDELAKMAAFLFGGQPPDAGASA